MMLEVGGAMMPDVYKKRNVSAIRRFPKDCGRYAPLLEGVVWEDVKDNTSSSALSMETLEVGKNLSNETLETSTKKETDHVQMLKQEPEGIMKHPQSLELEMEEKCNDGEQGASPLSKKTKASEKDEETNELSMVENPMELVGLSNSGVNDINGINPVVILEFSDNHSLLSNCFIPVELIEIDDGVSKLYGPSKRRKGFVNRHFPYGCGRNAPFMTREQCLKQSAGVSKTDQLKPLSNAVEKFQDTSEGKLQAVINGGVSGESKESSVCPTSIEETSNNNQCGLEDGNGDTADSNVFKASSSNISTMGGKKSTSMSPSPILLDSSHGIDSKNDESDVGEIAPRSGPEEGSCEEKFGKIVSTGEHGERGDVIAHDRLDGHESQTGEISGKDDTCLAEKLDKANEERDFSTHRVELMKIVKEARTIISDIEKELVDLDEPEDIETLQPLMTAPSCHWKQRLEGDVMLENTIMSTAGMYEELPVKKRKYLTMKSVLGSKTKAKKQVRPSKKKCLSFGVLPLKHRNRYAAEETENSLVLREEDDDTALSIIPMREEISVNLPSFISSCSNLNEICDDESPVPIKVMKASEKSLSIMKTKAKKQVRPSKKRFLSEGALPPKQRNRSTNSEVDDTAPAMSPIREDHCIDLPPFGVSWDTSCHDEVSARTRVRKVLRLYQGICRKLLQNEESSSKNYVQNHRIDFAAVNILKEKNQLLDTGGPVVGSIPGVEVGDQFHYRAELRLVGLHRSYQGGIDFTRIKNSLRALSIVASVGEADEMDNSDFLIYSGSGGRPSEGDKPPEDQKLERGNLALKNSIEAKTPVRVIRRCKDLGYDDSLDGKPKQLSTFTYDGLYLVEDYWLEKGPQGFFMYKFRLRRIPGQPEIALTDVRLKSGETRGLCVEDISEGREKIPIPVVNTVDDEKPKPFTYITKMIYPSWYEPMAPKGCDCTTKCRDSKRCSCAHKNGGEIPFNFNGAIVQAKTLVYECGPYCKCPPSCYNRVSQQGVRFRLEVFKTQSRGWGVRSLNSIPSGSFICEYMGELIQDLDAEQRSNDEYLFDIGHCSDDHDILEDPPTTPDSKAVSNINAMEDGGFTIDAAHYGNVGRFINHSCSPNLYAQDVIYDHDDKRMPHILFFAAENIPPLKELTYHYNYTIGQVLDSDGNPKRKDCHCGSEMCTGRLY